MKLLVLSIVLAAALLGVSLAEATTSTKGDQGRRLSGPFCIDKGNGTVHAIAAVQQCTASQIRKPGVAVQGPAGPKGDTGLTGATGATGAAGPPGANGTNGTSPTFHTASLCLVPASYGHKVVRTTQSAKPKGGYDPSPGDPSNTKYYVLNRACTDSDKGGVLLVVLTP